MTIVNVQRLGVGVIVLSAFSLWSCATPAVVFISPNYAAQPVTRVTVPGFGDFPGSQGSGATVSNIFEKYLFKLKYSIVDDSQSGRAIDPTVGPDAAALSALSKAGIDAVVLGTISELTDSSEQTVMVDVPQEVTEPVYQSVDVVGRHGRVHTITQQTGTQTIQTDQSIPETETLPARVGLTVRMLRTKNGEVLWTGSGSADGMNITSAADYAAAKIVDALQKDLAKPAK